MNRAALTRPEGSGSFDHAPGAQGSGPPTPSGPEGSSGRRFPGSLPTSWGIFFPPAQRRTLSMKEIVPPE